MRRTVAIAGSAAGIVYLALQVRQLVRSGRKVPAPAVLAEGSR